MCECFNQVNDLLKEKNTQLSFSYNLDTNIIKPNIVTKKIDTKKRVGPIHIYFQYCPFCGDKYPEKKEMAKWTTKK